METKRAYQEMPGIRRWRGRQRRIPGLPLTAILR